MNACATSVGIRPRRCAKPSRSKFPITSTPQFVEEASNSRNEDRRFLHPARAPTLRRMHADADLKRLSWRAHHRGTFEADLLVGGFFDAHHASWDADDRALFAHMLEEQDVDILAWANGTAEAPERYQGPMLEALKKLDYIPVAR